MTRFIFVHPTNPNRRASVPETQVAKYLRGGWTPVDEPRKPGGPVPSGQLVSLPDGNIAAVLDWVDEDPDRAEAALAAEVSGPNPRSTLIQRLEAITHDTPHGEEE